LAYRNDPDLQPTKALSKREQQVLAYAALGQSNKLIAYSLGLSLSSVSTLLARARRKLGPTDTLALHPDSGKKC
jgi:DNA-binding CsgD family transcriptional regulator